MQMRDVCLSLLEGITRSMDNRKRLQSYGLLLPSEHAPLPLAEMNALNEELGRYNAEDTMAQIQDEAPLG